MSFNSLLQEHLDHISGCDAEDDFEAQEVLYMADLKARGVFRKVIIATDSQYTEVIELSANKDSSDFFNKRVIWHSDSNGVEWDTVTLISKTCLDSVMRELDNQVQHYGDRVVEDIK